MSVMSLEEMPGSGHVKRRWVSANFLYSDQCEIGELLALSIPEAVNCCTSAAVAVCVMNVAHAYIQ